MNGEKEPRVRWEKIQEFVELYEQLGEWDRFIVLVRLYWLLCRSKIRTLPQRWATWQMRVKV